MKEKICFFVHTEYHLLLALDAIMSSYNDVNRFEVELILKRTSSSPRLKQDLDMSCIPYSVRFLDFSYNLKSKLSPQERENLDLILAMEFSSFNFFQEQDPISIIMVNHYKSRGTKINLYQDGLKPYVANNMSFSPSQWLNDIRQNLWIRKNGYPVSDYFSFIYCKNYGFLKGIDTLFLTFPQSYKNWNKLPIKKISPNFSLEFVALLKQVFKWDDSLLKERKRILFFMNQPMHDDGTFEVKILKHLQKKYPDNSIYIKNHPLTSQVKLNAYKELHNVTIIDSKIPAELFVSLLDNSIIFSVSSTSMFINNPKCKFYYIFGIKEGNNIKRIKKYKIFNPTDHVIAVTDVDDIKF